MDETPRPIPIGQIGKCALVADDDSIIRTILRSLLSDAGYTVASAASGREALSLASNLEGTFAILDLDMPDGNGLQTCAALRQIPKWDDVPIIILTSYPINKALKATLNAGANGFLCKPLVPSELMQAVADHIGRKVMVKPGLPAAKAFNSRLSLDPADTPAEPLPTVGSEWILR